jgi:hypothetical protein
MGSGGVAAPLHLEHEEQISPERARERAERLARREVLREARKGLVELPTEEWFEIPGRCERYCARLLQPPCAVSVVGCKRAAPLSKVPWPELASRVMAAPL